MLALHQKFIVNEKGRKTAIVLPYTEWEQILGILEEFDDICAYDKAKKHASDAISFQKALKILKDTE